MNHVLKHVTCVLHCFLNHFSEELSTSVFFYNYTNTKIMVSVGKFEKETIVNCIYAEECILLPR
jgi:hypothetical protein